MEKEKIHVCPKCGGREFGVTAHVTQDWVVDENGTFVRSLNDSVETTHYPNNEDIWDCVRCGHSSVGHAFLAERKISDVCRQIDDLGRIAIPKTTRRAAGFKEGDMLLIRVDENTKTVIVSKKNMEEN